MISIIQWPEILEQFEYPWQALDGIGQMILDLASNLDDEYEQIADQVWVHKSTQIAKTANLNGPCIIGAKTEVRPGAFIRGNALVGENCVVGNSTELKNVILFDHVQVPHYNYVGDSILGHYAHMGAGSITSNVKSDKSLVVINDRSHRIKIETGRKKLSNAWESCGGRLQQRSESRYSHRMRNKYLSIILCSWGYSGKINI